MSLDCVNCCSICIASFNICNTAVPYTSYFNIASMFCYQTVFDDSFRRAPSPVGKGVRWSSSEPDESAALSNTSNQQQAAASSSSNSQALPSSALPADSKSAPSSPFKQLGSAAVPNSLGNPAAAGGHAGLVAPASEGVPTGRVSALRQQLEATATTTTGEKHVNTVMSAMKWMYLTLWQPSG